jgi:xanthine dehydrogenase accessory factor
MLKEEIKMTPLNQLVIGIKGAGEMASAVAWRLYNSGFRKLFMMETDYPLAVRRKVSFCEAIHEGRAVVEGIVAIRVDGLGEIKSAWNKKQIAVMVDPEWTIIKQLRPQVIIDAILAKKNLGTNRYESPLVIALGPGFTAPEDVHLVIETNRGHDLGRVITDGEAEQDTGVPGIINGYAEERVLRAPDEGLFEANSSIGDLVKAGDILGSVNEKKIRAGIDGALRGLIRSGTQVKQGLKIGDIDPRGEQDYCFTLSDKARAIAGSVLEAILRHYNV